VSDITNLDDRRRQRAAQTGGSPAPAGAPSVLIATHSHPAVTKGGAEIAAWRLFEGVGAHSDWESWFLGCAREAGSRGGGGITQPFGEREFLYAPTAFDWFKFANQDKQYPRDLEAMLSEMRPDILHFHHYVNFGLETFLHARRILPSSRIILTLHEFQAICNHYGQMITREKKGLCYASSPRDCNACFPEFSRADFFLRREYIERFFALVDHFTAPSHFLAQRYIDWGIAPERMTVIENLTALPSPSADAPLVIDTKVFRVGFFGQISFLKGINVLLDAAKLLEEDEVLDIQFDIHGDYRGQPEEFQKDFLARLALAGHNVHFHGPYDNQRVDGLMRSVEMVLVPSIWWENSPVVIQECFRNRRPIVCSNIGGMAEKVRDGIDGFQFPVGSATTLAALLRRLADDRPRLAAIAQTMRYPAAPQEIVDAHLELYARVLAEPAIDA
jgi:glycosyltransferase involved in cell wall biosynthesis